MKKKLLMLLVMAVTLVSFISCDLAAKDDVKEETTTDDGTTDPVTRLDTETIILVPTPAADGFSLTASNVAFNAKSAVSILGATNTLTEADDYVIYAPTQFDALENGEDPEVTFTFSENLRANVNDAIYSITSDPTTLVSETGVASENVFYIDGSVDPVIAKSVTVSGMSVTFTFEAGTFTAEDLVAVIFGVTSEKGEYYKVSTAFQPLADVTSAVSLNVDFSDYYAWALDFNELYYLEKGIDETHTEPSKFQRKMVGVTPEEDTDFGHLVNTVLERFTNNDEDTVDETRTFYDGLLNLDDANFSTANTIKLNYTPATNATEYVLYYYYISGAPSLKLNVGSDYTVDVNNDLIVDISSRSIVTGDSFVLVPKNKRGEFTNHAGSYVMTDTVQPFTTDTIDLSEITPLQWTGLDYSDHTESPSTAGEIVSFGSFKLTDLGGWGDGVYSEAVTYSLESHSLEAYLPGSGSDGETKDVTADDVRAFLGEDVTLMSFGNAVTSPLWATFDGAELFVYVSLKCSSTNYDGETWQVTGDVNIKATDASGNVLLFQDDNLTPTPIENGVFNISLDPV